MTLCYSFEQSEKLVKVVKMKKVVKCEIITLKRRFWFTSQWRNSIVTVGNIKCIRWPCYILDFRSCLYS